MYDFDKIIAREQTASVKYDLREPYFGKADVLPMWVADMDFETPDFIRKAVQERAKHPIYGYSIREDNYYQSIVDWVKRRHNWEIEKEWIVHSPGIVPALNFSVLTFTNPGDGIIVQPPVYFPFFTTVEENGRELVYNELIEKENHYGIDFVDLEEKLKLGVKIFIMSNPHNPVGRVWKYKELEQIVELCEKYDVLILSDEIHADLTFTPHKHIPIASISKVAAQRTLSFMAASKTFNIAGLSTAFVVSQNKDLLKAYNDKMNAMHLFTGNVMGSIATKVAFEQGEEWRLQMLDYVKENINFVEQYLKENLPQIRFNKPEATYLIWLDFRALNLKQKELVALLINEAGVGLNDGSVFSPGGEGFMRLNVACSRAVIQKALTQISKVVNPS